MAKQKANHNTPLHRGRIQAQGGGVEESEPWASCDIPYKSNGHIMVDHLKMKLSNEALKQRRLAFDKVEKFIDRAPTSGWDVSTQSYPGCPPNRDVRVDVEIKKGKAFKDNQ